MISGFYRVSSYRGRFLHRRYRRVLVVQTTISRKLSLVGAVSGVARTNDCDDTDSHPPQHRSGVRPKLSNSVLMTSPCHQVGASCWHLQAIVASNGLDPLSYYCFCLSLALSSMDFISWRFPDNDKRVRHDFHKYSEAGKGFLKLACQQHLLSSCAPICLRRSNWKSSLSL